MNTIEERVAELKNLLAKQGVSWNDPEDEGAQQILFEHEKLLRQALQEVSTQGKLDALGEVKEYLLNRLMKYDSKDGYSTLHDDVIEHLASDIDSIILSHIASILKLTTGKL